MTAIAFYFQAHQPYRLNPYNAGDVGTGKPYFDDDVNRQIVKRVADRCYRPMNAQVLDQIDKTDGRFRCAFSLSGTVIQQLKDWAPKALDSFVELAETGCVEFLAETSHHSLAFVIDPDEFTTQVTQHCDTIESLFGRRPTTFRNTELCIDEDMARRVEAMGFEAMLGEGADRMLGWRSSHFVYIPQGCESLRLLLRNYVFSDDIAFRFSNRDWPHHPLFADTFASWIHDVPQQAQYLGLFMDYETFGEHQWADTGIFEFMAHLPGHVLEDERFSFQTPSEIAASCDPVAWLEIPGVVSWADEERDLSAWVGNEEQQAAHAALYALKDDVLAAAADGRPDVLRDWRRLTTSDHVYYMSRKCESDGEVHEYFSPYEGPQEAFVRFMSCLDDLKGRLTRKSPAKRSSGRGKSARRKQSVKKAAHPRDATKTTASKKRAAQRKVAGRPPKKTRKKAARKRAQARSRKRRE